MAAGVMTGADIAREARALLQDPTAVHWGLADMKDWISAFQRDVITYKPKAGSVNKLLDLVAGVKQTLPAGTIQLLDITTNMGASGTDPGRAITRTTVERMAAGRPTWRQDTATDTVRQWMSDDRDETTYYVWPPLSGATKVEALTVDMPDAVTDLSANLAVNSSYQNAGVHYVLFRAYSQDQDDSANATLAGAHYAMYANMIGIEVKGQKKASPGANSTVNPTYPAVDKNGE